MYEEERNTLSIFAKKGKIPPLAITASLTGHPIKSIQEYISLTPPAFRLFADGSEIIQHQQKFENSPFSRERKTISVNWLGDQTTR